MQHSRSARASRTSPLLAPAAAGLALLLVTSCRSTDGGNDLASGASGTASTDGVTAESAAGGTAESAEAPASDLERALTWLVDSQERDGSWAPASGESAAMDPAGNRVGVTGLAALALLAEGNTLRGGPRKEPLRRAIAWLLDQQQDSGAFGAPMGHTYLYGHAIGLLAVSEASVLTGEAAGLVPAVKRGTAYAERARNPYGAWRYDVPPVGDNDTSISGWMLTALCAARDAGAEVEAATFEGAWQWLDSVTDPETGRVGYDSRGSRSSRIPGVNDQYPSDAAETLTSVAMFARAISGAPKPSDELARLQEDLLLAKLPLHDPEANLSDPYAWYFGSLAAFQRGGRLWKAWQPAMAEALEAAQDEDGSFPPSGPWDSLGGRTQSTALCAMTLTVQYRYSRLAR